MCDDTNKFHRYILVLHRWLRLKRTSMWGISSRVISRNVLKNKSNSITIQGLKISVGLKSCFGPTVGQLCHRLDVPEKNILRLFRLKSFVAILPVLLLFERHAYWGGACPQTAAGKPTLLVGQIRRVKRLSFVG